MPEITVIETLEGPTTYYVCAYRCGFQSRFILEVNAHEKHCNHLSLPEIKITESKIPAKLPRGIPAPILAALYCLLIALVVYLVTAFFMFDWRPDKWGDHAREFALYTILLFSMPVVSTTLMKGTNK